MMILQLLALQVVLGLGGKIVPKEAPPLDPKAQDPSIATWAKYFPYLAL